MNAALTSILLLCALPVCTLPAAAAERCTVPRESWRPVDELRAELTGKGWTIANIKTEDGCYEVYGTDGEGKRSEIFFDPASFEPVGSDD